MTFSELAKTELNSIIHEMNSVSWMYSKNPDSDFSGNPKMNFESTIRFILSMESNSLKKELLEFFRFSENTPSASAFSQCRNKLLIDSFKYLFYKFNSRFKYQNNYKGYRLLVMARI